MQDYLGSQPASPPADISLSEALPATRNALSFRTYSYRETLFVELEKLVQENKRFDGLIIDLMQIDYSLPMSIFIKFHTYAKRLLKPMGAMLFIKTDGGLSLSKDAPGSELMFCVYDSPFHIFARYPLLADYVCATISGIDRRRMRGGGNSLANHILYTSTPVLTTLGQQAKQSFEVSPPQNWLLQSIDDYASVERLVLIMEQRHQASPEETVQILQELEAQRLVFPLFPRIPFLSDCYHNRKAFRLGRYMVAAGLISPSQLEELLQLQQEEGYGRSQRCMLGVLAIRQQYLNTRQLEVLLHDQYLYGGYHRTPDSGQSQSNHKRSIETMRNSMIGSLEAIDSAGLLQSIATAQKTGLLTVENRESVILLGFQAGKPTHAKLGKLVGYDAIVEYLVSWTEGIFVFRDGGMSTELSDDCVLPYALEKILLDAALSQDNCQTLLAEYPNGRNAVPERVWNLEELWPSFISQQLFYFDESPVLDSDKEHIYRIALLVDGFSTLDELLKSISWKTTYFKLRAFKLLLDYQLIVIQQTSLFKPMSAFQTLINEMTMTFGLEDNRSLLESSLHYVHGASPVARRFSLDRNAYIGVNVSLVKNDRIPVSTMLKDFRRWMEAYLSYCRRQFSSDKIDAIVSRTIGIKM